MRAVVSCRAKAVVEQCVQALPTRLRGKNTTRQCRCAQERFEEKSAQCRRQGALRACTADAAKIVHAGRLARKPLPPRARTLGARIGNASRHTRRSSSLRAAACSTLFLRLVVPATPNAQWHSPRLVATCYVFLTLSMLFDMTVPAAAQWFIENRGQWDSARSVCLYQWET
ncbi:MAG: hypothetical protein KatS3mg040_0314 [Candidatus Kapaibacterium sp.]|nr:MAG: hypothetical protein KatS3mg040_0314 [Candidatus Kapabacteria bacterium]